VILVKTSITCRIVDHTHAIEAVAADIHHKQDKIRFVCCYLTNANGGVSHAQVQGFESFIDLMTSDIPLVIAGDFNMPNIDWSQVVLTQGRSVESEFANICLSSGLIQLVDEPTRLAVEERHSLPDLVLTTDADLIANLKVGKPPFRSDHEAVTFDVLSMPAYSLQSDGSGLNFYKGDYGAIEANLQLVTWVDFFRDCMLYMLTTCITTSLHTSSS
jgi:Endonuclease-reverse transcriptase